MVQKKPQRVQTVSKWLIFFPEQSLIITKIKKNTKISSIKQDKIHKFCDRHKITRNSGKQENMAHSEEGEKNNQ